MKTLRLGTRGSALAKAQALIVKSAVESFGCAVSIVEITTSGDAKQSETGNIVRDKKDWIQELEVALLQGQIDFAVHSGKDVPCDIADGTKLTSILDRADPRDCFIGRLEGHGKRVAFSEICADTVVGTASLRRMNQLKKLIPGVIVKELRGNVTTRVGKLDSGHFDGIILAKAGLDRLGLDINTEPLSTVDFVPAVNQGILACQFRAGDIEMDRIANALCEITTQASFVAERECIRVLGADCHSSVGVFAEVLDNEEIEIVGRVIDPVGLSFLEDRLRGRLDDALSLGVELGERLVNLGAREYL